MFKRTIFAVLALSIGLSMSACNERDVRLTTQVVGAALLTGAAYDYYHNRDYRYVYGYDRDRYFWDRYDGRYYYDRGRWNRRYNDRWDRRDGRWDRRDGRWDRRNDRRGDRRGRGFLSVAPMAINERNVNPTQALAKKYIISPAAARTILATFQSVKQSGKLDAFQRLGMDRGAIEGLYRGQSPSSVTVAHVAQTLGARRSSVNALIRDITNEFSLHAQQGWKN